MGQAQRDADEYVLDEPEAFERYVRLLLTLPTHETDDRWAAMIGDVMRDTARPLAARLDFIERHLIPRITAAEPSP